MRRLLPIIIALLAASCMQKVSYPKQIDATPEIFPDYVDVTVPSCIAPLNFSMADESAERIDVVVTGVGGRTIHVQGSKVAQFPSGKWHSLLAGSEGGDLTVSVSAKSYGSWKSYAPFKIQVSSDSIDEYLAYRLISPSYGTVGQIGLYQRNITNFDQRSVFESRENNACLNCHAFKQGDASSFTFHVRGPKGGTFIQTPGDGRRLFNTKTDSTISNCAYPYWHPSGRYIAYSTNRTAQGYHQKADKMLEVYDSASDINVYDIENNKLISEPWVSRPEMLESFPVFSADGHTLYFTCSKAQEIPQGITEIRYDLCKVDFDPSTGTIGSRVDTVIFAARQGKSVIIPKPSYDGRYIMYSLADYGTFSVWHPESDLWLLDLQSGQTRELTEANSPQVECSHSWSTSSRWFVFGSRRDNGLFTYAYICHLDENGNCAKPFLLPQKNPREFYDGLMKSFNIPEFISSPMQFDRRSAVYDLQSSNREQFEYWK